MKTILLMLLLAALCFAVYLRRSGYDAARWHVPPRDGVEREMRASFRTIRPMTAPAAEVLDAIMKAAEATPHTRLMSGSPEEGLMTFESRSPFWRFPDYTTVGVLDGKLSIFARSRYAGRDWGKNRERVETWLAVIGPLAGPPD